jgi:Peptidase family M23
MRTTHLLPAAALAAVLLALLPPPAAAADWSWPVRGDVITPFRNSDDPYAAGQHRGIDIAAPIGEPVAAATGGTVTFAGTAGTSGLTVNVRTRDGDYDTSYLHLSSIAVRRGDQVERGRRLGAVGVTGRRSAEQPHLHFGVRQAGSDHAYLDPLRFLPPLPPPAQDPPRAPAPVPAPEPARPAPAPVAVPRAVPRGRPAPARRGARPHPARSSRPSHLPQPSHAFERGHRAAVAHGPGATRVPAPPHAHHPARRPARTAAAAQAPPVQAPGDHADATSPSSRSPAKARSSPVAWEHRAGTGFDLGWALACAALLVVGAALSRPANRADGRRTGLRALAALLRPLAGRG